MATTFQHRSHPMGHPTVRKSRTKKTVSQQPPSTIKNNSKDIKIRFGNNSSQNSMYKPHSILKKKPFEPTYTNHFSESVGDWRQPSNLEAIRPRRIYSPIHTPPRLRTLITPPGLDSYRNHYHIRGIHSPLPTLGERYSAPLNLETWGLDPTDYHLNPNLNLIRRYPSPLTQYGLGSGLRRQKKSYIVVPRLTNLLSPPVSSGGAGSFTLPSRRTALVYVPDSQYTYLHRIDSFSSSRFHREPSDYVYIRQNEAFANHYVEDFIGTSIEDQLIPDILLEVIGELDQENTKRGGKSYKTDVERYYADLHRRINQEQIDNSHLFSDDWIHGIDDRYSTDPIPPLRPADLKEFPPAQRTSRLRYNELPSDVQGGILADVNQELIDLEVGLMMAEISDLTLTTKLHHVPARKDTTHDMHHNTDFEVPREVMHHTKPHVDQAQFNEIEKYAQNKLLDTVCLDELTRKYLREHGSVVDIDDMSRFLDATILGNLIFQFQDIDESRSRTLDNYSSRKFHLNSFMNITMDLLLTELSASLIEDMKDLEEQERRKF